MHKLIMPFLVLCLYINSHAQNSYKPGYFIDNNNVKIECLIKDKNERNNPKRFKFKPSKNETVQIGGIDSIKEFCIYPDRKYIRFQGEIDRSGFDDKSTTHNQNPEYTRETLFLKVLCEGRAWLYSYLDGPLERYFYKIENTTIKQLVYKDFKVMNLKIPDRNYTIRRNKAYLSQLMSDLSGQALSFDDIKNIEYEESDLVKLFNKYNGVSLYENKNAQKRSRGNIHFALKPAWYLTFI